MQKLLLMTNNIQIYDDLIKKRLSNKRYIHSLGVAKLSKELAICNNVDTNKAYLAGLLHDVTKELSNEEQDQILIKHNDLDKLDVKPSIKHSFTAKYFLMDELGIEDEDILDAVYNHTICKSNKPLSKIVYIADKREENRHIDDNIVDIAKNDLDRAFKELSEDVYRYLRNKGEKCTTF